MNYESGLKIVQILCQVIESKITRIIKFAQPALLQIKEKVGEEKLEAMILACLNQAPTGNEETKTDE